MKLLLAIESSDFSVPPVTATTTRPWPPGTIVRVFTVVESDYPPGFIAEALITPPPFAQSNDTMEREAWELVHRVVRALHAVGLEADGVVRHGSPGAEIVAHAESWRPDLILMGSHGRTGLRRVLLGSVAQHVVGHAPCSVEIVRGPRDDRVEAAVSGPAVSGACRRGSRRSLPRWPRVGSRLRWLPIASA
jgi:nucleotide-binding universal stress UspA family protein